MGILDDAIREHLDLKRKHGAPGSELQSIEDEAFGSGERPDPFAAGELFGEVGASPPGEPGAGEEPTRVVPAAEEPEAGPAGEPGEGPLSGEPLEPPTAQAPPVEAPPPPVEDGPPAPPEPAAPDTPEPPAEAASLDELLSEEDSTEMAAPPPPPPPDTAEAARPGGETAAPPPEQELPPRELVGEPEQEEEPEADAEEQEELEAEEADAVPPPPPPPPESGPEPPGRARGRVDVPTQEYSPPPAGTDERDALDDALVEEAPAENAPAGEAEPVSDVYDFATDEESFGAESDDFEALGPVTDEPAVEKDDEAQESEEFESEGYTDEGTAVRDPEDTDDFNPSTLVRDPDSEEFDSPAPVPETDEHDAEAAEADDILAGSPEFVEEGEDEDLWFEKGPPKDFDFEDENEDQKK